MNPLTNMKNQQKMNERELSLGMTGTSSSWHSQYEDSAWIFVGGLPYELSEGDVICIFSQYGEIVNINLVRDKDTGKSKGFAFLCYEDQRSTILAVDNLNGAKVLGRAIRVDHKHNYQVPKVHGDEDELIKKLREEGCAPTAVLTSGSQLTEKKKKKKDKKKKKHKRSKDDSLSSSSSHHESDVSPGKERHKCSPVRIKQENVDEEYYQQSVDRTEHSKRAVDRQRTFEQMSTERRQEKHKDTREAKKDDESKLQDHHTQCRKTDEREQCRQKDDRLESAQEKKSCKEKELKYRSHRSEMQPVRNGEKNHRRVSIDDDNDDTCSENQRRSKERSCKQELKGDRTYCEGEKNLSSSQHHRSDQQLTDSRKRHNDRCVTDDTRRLKSIRLTSPGRDTRWTS